MSHPVIETERLILRPFAPEDFEGWAEMMADEDTARFIGGVQPRAAAWRGFLTMAGAWTIQGFSMFSVVEKDTGRWVGRLGPWVPEGWPGTEVIHCIDPDNVASQKVAERLGSRRLRPGALPAPFESLPIDIWGQSREDWRARRR